MQRTPTWIPIGAWIIACLAWGAPGAAAGGKHAPRPAPTATGQRPTWKAVDALFRKERAAAGTSTWLVQPQVEALFEKLENPSGYSSAGQKAAAGWKPNDAGEILSLVPLEEEFLSRQLLSPRGLAFQRLIAKDPRNFDRLERMSQLLDGQKMIADLMAGPAGHHDMLKYMISPAGGKQLWSILPGARDAKDFDQPTGRVYTWDQLLTRLKASYDAGGSTSRRG